MYECKISVRMLELINGVLLNKLRHKKADDVKLNTKQHHLNRDTVQGAVLLQERKFRTIPLKFCSSHSN